MDGRFTEPLFTPAQVERYLLLPRSKLRTWMDANAVTRIPADDWGLSVPYAGLLEAMVVADLRGAGLGLTAIREASDKLKAELGLPHPLIWRNLAHDGKDILAPFEAGWRRARDSQLGLPEVIDCGLRKVIAWQDDFPAAVQLDNYGGVEVASDPDYAGGHPVHWASGVRVEDIVTMAHLEGSLDVTAQEYAITRSDVERLVLSPAGRGLALAA